MAPGTEGMNSLKGEYRNLVVDGLASKTWYWYAGCSQGQGILANGMRTKKYFSERFGNTVLGCFYLCLSRNTCQGFCRSSSLVRSCSLKLR